MVVGGTELAWLELGCRQVACLIDGSWMAWHGLMVHDESTKLAFFSFSFPHSTRLWSSCLSSIGRLLAADSSRWIFGCYLLACWYGTVQYIARL